MAITAKIIADSISSAGQCITTLQLMYPRFIHAEFMTHRVFSRNASSSRAIPVAKMIEQVRTNPAMPIHWGKNQPGMQASETVDDPWFAEQLWRSAANEAANAAEAMMGRGLHKQVVNRILEPFQHIHVVVTATEWEGFFVQRDHPDAEPNIQVLAREMLGAMRLSTPKRLSMGEWHLPYVTEIDRSAARAMGLDISALCKISAARCARVSYLRHDGTNSSIEEDLALYDKLIGSHPMHASPIEHQATPDDCLQVSPHSSNWRNPKLHGNFVGWIQHRKLIEQSLN